MTVGHSSAIEQALALLRAPALLAAVRQRPLPDDLPQLFRLAAGDDALYRQIESATGEPRAQLEEAAIFYLQQVLFAPGADSYRVLGVAPDAADEQIKQHFRLLQRWLHPDRNHDEWDAVYADRVNRAWQDLRTPERRAEYDRRPPESPVAAATAAGAMTGGFRARPMPMAEAPVLSSRAVRRLPWLVLGGLGLFAAVGLGGAWYLQQLGSTRPALEPTAVEGVDSYRAAATVEAASGTPPATDARPGGQEDPITLPAELPPAPAAAEAPASPAVAAAPAPAEVPESPPPPKPVALPVAVEQPAVAYSAARAPVEPAALAARESVPAPVVTIAPEPPSVPLPAPAPTSSAAPVAQVVNDASTVPADTQPDAAVTVEADFPTAPPVLDEREAMALLAAFQRNYGAGDLQGLLGLFTGDARNNRGGLKAIGEDYEQLFRSTDSRRIEWREPVWLGNGARGNVSARYRATVLPSGELRPNIVEGDIRFDLRLEGDSVRIERVRHQ